MAAPINKSLRGIRDRIPGGYILGRTGAGSGPPILLPVTMFTTPGFVANTTIQVGGPAGGDLSGTYPNPKVVAIQGVAVKATPPTDGQIPVFVNANSDIEWETKGFVPAGGTTGQVLTKVNGTDFNTDWETPSAGGAGSLASIQDDGTNVYVALSDSVGNLITSGGLPIFVKEVFPNNAIPPPNAGLGGVQAVAPVAHNWLTGISVLGVPSVSQPATPDLSDYETGTWIPVDMSGAGLVLTQVGGGFTRIGNMVFAYGTALYPSTSDASAAFIGGLPFTISGSNYGATPNAASSGAGVGLIAKAAIGTTSFTFIDFTSGASRTNAVLSGARVFFNLSYPIV